MALRQQRPVRIGSGAAEHYVVVNPHCQLRPAPNHDYVAIGLLRTGCQFRGFPYVCEGQPWVKLHDQEAAVHVPDKHVREDGVWVPHSNPRYGKLIQSQEQSLVYGKTNQQSASDGKGNGNITDGGKAFKHSLILRSNGSYEESIQLQWVLKALESDKVERLDSVVELVIDTASGRTPTAGETKASDGEKELLTPAEGATVKRVECGKDLNCSLSNMPDGRYFLASVICTLAGNRRLRSRWIRVATLNKGGRNMRLGSVDRLGNLRGKCTAEGCPCEGFIPQSEWNLNSAPQTYCRRCACKAEAHIIVKHSRQGNEEESEKVGEKKDEPAEKSTIPFPPEAETWNERQKNLWQWSNGALHPTENHHARRFRKPRRPPTGVAGKVSVVVPTTEDRQHFHEQIWSCFVNQAWPSKELIIVETYKSRASPFFTQINDNRLIFLKFRCGKTFDLSIGAKRNIAMHVADGDYLASFDDDDIYAPTYLETMIAELVDKQALFITLSTWYFFEVKTGQFGFCDPYAWAKAKNLTDKQIYGWLWGYGFSYVHRLQPALERKILYPDQNMSEDINFIKEWKKLLGANCACLLFDKTGIVLHTIHGRNTSNSFGLREVPREEVLDTDFADLYDILKIYLERFPRKDGVSGFILNKVDDKKRIKRKYRDLLIHRVGGVPAFNISCVRGVTGAQLKETCAQKLHSTPGDVKLFRKRPTPEQALGETKARPQNPNQDQEEMEFHFRRLCCTWVYGKNQTEYTTSRGQKPWTISFTGPHARTGTVIGTLDMTPAWMIGDLFSLDGEHVGSIRLRYIQDIDSMVSNFKALTREEWGKDIIAQRVGELPSEEEDEASASQNQDENAPIQDDERLELRAKELWVVLSKKPAEAAGANWANVLSEAVSTTTREGAEDEATTSVEGTGDRKPTEDPTKSMEVKDDSNPAEDPATLEEVTGDRKPTEDPAKSMEVKDESKPAEDPATLEEVTDDRKPAEDPAKSMGAKVEWNPTEDPATLEEVASDRKPTEDSAKSTEVTDELKPAADPAALEEVTDKQLDENESRTSSKSARPTSEDGDWAELVAMFHSPGQSPEHDNVAGQKFEDDQVATSVEVAGDLELTIYIDYELGIKEMFHVKAESTILSVKEQLLDRLHVTGDASYDQFALKLLGSTNGPLPDAELVVAGQTELELCD